MDHFHRIFAHRAADYQRMIAPEDTDGNLLAALRTLTDWRGRRLIDLGTGTGRIPLLLRDEGVRAVGLDLHESMLREAAAQLRHVHPRWSLVRGEMRMLPFRDGCADAVTAGWSLGHSRGWYADQWETHMSTMLREMHRVVAPGGWLVILETLTTGAPTPAPPTAALEEYYTWLEREWGFACQTLQTDYAFASVDDAVSATEFFFGSTLSQKIRTNGWKRIPEWTGMWSKQVGAA